MNAPPATQGQVYADIRTRIDLMLGEEPDEVTIMFSVPRDGLSLDEVKLIDQSIYESVPDMDGVAFISVVVDGNNDQLISVKIHRKL